MKSKTLKQLLDEHNAIQPAPTKTIVHQGGQDIGGMMKVRIEEAGIYAEMDGQKMNARDYKVGEMLTGPEWYCQEMIDKNLASRIVNEGEIEVVVVTEPEIIDIAEQVNASAAARRLAEENGLDLAGIIGTGKGGGVTVSDVREMLGDKR